MKKQYVIYISDGHVNFKEGPFRWLWYAKLYAKSLALNIPEWEVHIFEEEMKK
jgi:hypothetical protein